MVNQTLPESFMLPDLVSHCPYPLRVNIHCYEAARASEQWLLEGAKLSEKRAVAFTGLKAGELTAACYPDADLFHLRVCDDFMNYLFNLDDWLDEFNVDGTHGMADCCIEAMRDPFNYETDKKAGIMTKSFFSRFVQSAGPGARERFIQNMDLFFQSVVAQSLNHAQGMTPDIESYIAVRRDNSGCKPCFQCTEFAAGIDLPDEVIEHPIIQSLEEATNDLVTWSNDIFSFNVEQSRHDNFNLVCVVMQEKGYDLQGAIDFVGDMCRQTIERFQNDRNYIPSWGPEIDRDVAIYVDGLQNWIVGSLHWSFDSERYFGKLGQDVKKRRIVKLLPKRPL